MQLFILQEAEALIPLIREELIAMQACKRDVDALRDDLEHSVSKSTGNGHVRDENTLVEKRRRAEALVDEINQRLRQLNDWGVELKDLDEGLVDFPSERQGRTVYLCWRLGEDRIASWHELDTGYASRQPL